MGPMNGDTVDDANLPLIIGATLGGVAFLCAIVVCIAIVVRQRRFVNQKASSHTVALGSETNEFHSAMFEQQNSMRREDTMLNAHRPNGAVYDAPSQLLSSSSRIELYTPAPRAPAQSSQPMPQLYDGVHAPLS